MILTKDVFQAGDKEGIGVIPDFLLNVFEGADPSSLLARLAERGDVTIVGDIRMFDRLLWPVHGFPVFSHMVSMCFVRVDNRTPSVEDTSRLPFADKIDRMIECLNWTSRYNVSDYYGLAGDLEATTAICYLANDREYGWGLLPTRALVRVFPEDEFNEAAVVILTTEIQDGQLILRFFELPPEHASLHYDDCRILLTRTADEGNIAHE